ncbi:hypothetical protein RJ640_005348 [Escallonia rubra]|uniref:Hemerythrin-like domain-containing protein n=1 Tax=Escallonia rubra TaxID=112253 RepID=A0AA88QBH4_9ASTE|nr:hypothetical protein RJ640_005348 [Escallonia rubra]
MDSGEGKCAGQDDGDEEEEPPGPPLSTAEGPLAGVRLEDAPIMFLVLFHRAFREELLELSRIAAEAAESGFLCGDVVLDLRRRFEFLKVVYEYHCTAEDEVIFQALDVRVKNVVCTYSLEHKSIDELFNSIFHCFNILVSEDEDIFKPYQELVFCIGTIQASICQHMMKEEKQVFPLLMKKFSSEEQASLVWQFMCSIPVMLLEKILQWITFSLSPDDQFDVERCIKEVVLKDKLLEEVVTSWLGNKKRSFFEANDNYAKGAQFLNGIVSFQDILNVYPSNGESGEEQKSKNAKSIYTTGRGKLIDVVHLWHGAIRKVLREILDELYRIRSSNTSSTLSSVVVQLIFFVDILIFYR